MQLRKLIYIVLFLFNTHLFGQQSNISFKCYTLADGLADNFVSDIVKDNFGFIWIAGRNGLTRFDGNNFWVFNNKNQSDFFQSNNSYKLYNTGDKIYLLSKEEGLIELDPQKLSFKKITERGIVAMFQKKDTVVHLYSDGFLELKKGKSPLIKKLLKYNSKDDVVIHNSKVYVSSYHLGIFEHDLSDLEQKRVFYEPQKTGYFIYPSPKYGIVLNMCNRLMVLDQNNDLKNHPEVESSKIVTSYSEYSDGTNQVIYQFRIINLSDSLSFYSYIQREIPNVELKKILNVNEKTILIASNQGLIKITYNSQKYIENIDDNKFFNSEGLRVRRKILEGDKGNFYMLGYPSLVEYDAKTKAFKNLSGAKTNISFYDGIIVDSIIYMTSEGSGFFSYNLRFSKFSKIPLSDFDTLTGLYHISILNDSTLLIGGLGNVITYNIKSKTNVTYSIGKKINVYDIEADKFNANYLVATDIGLLSFKTDNTGKIVFSKKTLPTKTSVKDILVDEENQQIWLATNHGIELRKGSNYSKIREYSKSNEIGHQKVTALLKDNSGRIWASTYSGILVVDFKNNNSFFIDRLDGLRNEEFNYKCATKLKNGNLVFGGLNAYDIIKPEILNNKNYINRFFITGIQKTVNESSNYFSYADFSKGNISFNTGEEDLYIYLSNFDFADKSGYRFEFKKANYDWIPVVKSRIRLSNDKPGTYKMSIRMLNPLGVIVDEKTFFIIAKVPFYQSYLFFIQIAVLVSLLSALSIFLFFRTLKIERRTKERIALDLHDEAGTLLTRLLMLISNSSATPSTDDKIKFGLNEALFRIRTYTNSITGKKPYIHSFEIDIKEILSDELKNSRIIFENNFNYENNIKITQELYRDMKLCICEAASYIINYSNKGNLKLDFTIEKKVALIKVEYDSIVSENYLKEYFINGISIMEKRTQRHNGNLIVNKENALELVFSFKIK